MSSVDSAPEYTSTFICLEVMVAEIEGGNDKGEEENEWLFP